MPNDPASNRCFGKEFNKNVRPMSYENYFLDTHFKSQSFTSLKSDLHQILTFIEGSALLRLL